MAGLPGLPPTSPGHTHADAERTCHTESRCAGAGVSSRLSFRPLLVLQCARVNMHMHTCGTVYVCVRANAHACVNMRALV
jgi:hypothetical protein